MEEENPGSTQGRQKQREVTLSPFNCSPNTLSSKNVVFVS